MDFRGSEMVRRLCTWQTGLMIIYLLGAAGLSLWVPATVPDIFDRVGAPKELDLSAGLEPAPDNDGFVPDPEQSKSMNKGKDGDTNGAKVQAKTADPYSAMATPVAPDSPSTLVTLSANDLEIVSNGPRPSRLAYVFVWKIDAQRSIRWKPYLTHQFFLAVAAAVVFFGIRFCRLWLSAVRMGLSSMGSLLGCRREICIWLAAGIIATALLVPPWWGVVRLRGYIEDREQMPHSPLWRGTPTRYGWSVSIDYGRMTLEILALEVLVGALYLTWGRKKG